MTSDAEHFDPDLFDPKLYREGPEFCPYCGREMVDTLESEGFDTATGRRIVRLWRSCPRWFNSWRNVWGFMAGVHRSYAPGTLMGREYR